MAAFSEAARAAGQIVRDANRMKRIKEAKKLGVRPNDLRPSRREATLAALADGSYTPASLKPAATHIPLEAIPDMRPQKRVVKAPKAAALSTDFDALVARIILAVARELSK